MKTWVIYGLANAVIGLVIGTYIAITALGDSYFVFAIAAPIAAFLTGGLIWKLIVKEHLTRIRILIAGVLTGTISHYITFVLLGITMNICYWTTGACTGSLGDPPASILLMVGGAFAFSFFSLMFFGWLTAPTSVAIGMILRQINRKKKATHQKT